VRYKCEVVCYYDLLNMLQKDYLHKYKKFSDLGLGEPILDVIRSKGLTNPSHIQVSGIHLWHLTHTCST